MRIGLGTVDSINVTSANPNSPAVITPYPTAPSVLTADSGYDATGTRARLRTKIVEVEPQTRGQAFWDSQLEVINYHVVPHNAYDSYIQGERVRIDTDSDGRPVFLELEWDRSKHLIVNDLTPPTGVIGSVRFLDLRIRFHEREVISTPCHSITYIDLGRGPSVHNLILGSGLILGLSGDGGLSDLWIVGAIPDTGGRLQSRWRLDAWDRIRKQRAAGAMKLAGDKISTAFTPKVY